MVRWGTISSAFTSRMSEEESGRVVRKEVRQGLNQPRGEWGSGVLTEAAIYWRRQQRKGVMHSQSYRGALRGEDGTHWINGTQGRSCAMRYVMNCLATCFETYQYVTGVMFSVAPLQALTRRDNLTHSPPIEGTACRRLQLPTLSYDGALWGNDCAEQKTTARDRVCTKEPIGT